MREPEIDNQGAPGATSVITRRQALKLGVAAGATAVWAVPVVQTIGMGAAGAQAASGSPTCTGSSYDLQAIYSGAVTGRAGPAQSSDDVHDCLATATITAPVGGEIAQLDHSCTTSGCPAIFSLASGSLDLNGAGIPIAANFSVVRVSAEATCTSHETTFEVTSLQVFVGGLEVTPDLEAAGTLDLSTLPVSVPGLTGFITLKEVIETTSTVEANLLHIVATYVTPVTLVTQSVEVRFAHAESAIAGCP